MNCKNHEPVTTGSPLKIKATCKTTGKWHDVIGSEGDRIVFVRDGVVDSMHYGKFNNLFNIELST